MVGPEVGYGEGGIMITMTGMRINVGNIGILLMLIQSIHSKLLLEEVLVGKGSCISWIGLIGLSFW